MKNSKPINVASLVFGLLFLGVSLLWGLLETEAIGSGGLEVAAPVMLVSIGIAGLLASISKFRRPPSREHIDRD